MNFATYNRPWLEEMQAQVPYIRRSGALERLQSLLVEQGAHKTPLLPIPLSIDKRTFDALATAGLNLLSAQTKILRYLHGRCSRAEMLRRFDMPETMEPVVDWDELLVGAHTICRADVLPSNDGYYFCELNPDSSVGGTEVSDCLQVLCNGLRWPLTETMESPQQATVQLLRRVVEQKGLQRIVLCDWTANRGSGYFSFDLLRKHLARALPELEIHLVYHTEYPEAWLTPEEGRRTLVHRGFMYNDMDDGGAFVHRLVNSGATIINTLETEMRMHKSWFSMFCDPAYHHLLTAGEVESIARYVPHTVAVNRDNLEELLRRKADLVFKLGASYGGEAVLIGANHSADALREAIAAKGLKLWIAQKAIVFDGIDLPYTSDFQFTRHNVVLGLFLIDGRASGVTVGASHGSKVVNIHTGKAGYSWAVPMTAEEQARYLTAMRHGNAQP
ncbi:hypothetical protein [Pendulispora albinea]|uniref:Uncharacterized protein n=1 Tax=Pendulispora albinea TaxID=2741071 RepID=A0ABZ2M597_9BACT